MNELRRAHVQGIFVLEEGREGGGRGTRHRMSKS
jgi:hypothetical protein